MSALFYLRDFNIYKQKQKRENACVASVFYAS